MSKMDITKRLVFFAFAISACNAILTLAPMGKELIYDWKALVRAGTHDPVSYASQFVLHGKLHLQANENSTLVQLTDLKHQLYNGLLDHIHELEAQDMPIPIELKDLELPFKIVYQENGLVLGLTTETKESDYVRNMKKSIATILQLDNIVISEKKNQAFVRKEHSIYGLGTVDYNVLHHDDMIEVHKLHDMHHSGHLYQLVHSNTEPIHCDMPHQEAIMHDNQKKYMIVKEDGHEIIKEIVANGAIFYYPLNAKSDSQYILVNQTMRLMQMVPVQQKLELQSEHFENHLTFKALSENPTHAVHDVTHGRFVTNYELLIPQVHEMIEGIWTYLHQDHIHMKEPDTKQGQLINRLQRILLRFDMEHLKNIQTSLASKTGLVNEEMYKIFLNMLPMIGTKASAMMIKTLIEQELVSSQVAVKMLQDLPENLLIPDEQLVMDLEVLIHLPENVDWQIRKAAILSFGTLIHKTVEWMIKMEKNQQLNMDHEDINVMEIENKFNKYVLEYVNKAKTSQDLRVQLTYLSGLSNMKMLITMKHMLPAMRGEWSNNHHLRVMAMMASATAIMKDPNQDTIIETLWPIFTDRLEHLELRMLAYYFIMQSHPSHSRLTNIYWYMMTEANEELYHFHYTYVQTMMHTKEPCMEHLKLRYAQMMKFMHPSSHGISSVSLSDFKDLSFGFSGGIETMSIFTNQSQIMKFTSTSQLFNLMNRKEEVYIKLHGFMNRPMDLVTFFGDMHKMNNNNQGMKDIHIEVVVVRHDHVKNTFYFNQKNLHEIQHLLDMFVQEKKSLRDSILTMNYQRFHQIILPTDLGIPAVWEYVVPMVNQLNLTLNKEMVKNVVKVQLQARLTTWIHYKHGLSFYNPIADVWQGINRFQAYDSVLPINLELMINMQQNNVQLSWKKLPEQHLNVLGLRSHVKQMVFIEDIYHRNMLTKSTQNGKEWIMVTNGDKFRNQFTLMDDDNLNTGHKWHVAVYDSERHVSNGTFTHLMHLFSQPQTQHYDDPITHMMMMLSNMHKYIVLMPQPQTHGLMIRIEPSEEHVVTNIDLSIRSNWDRMDSGMELVLGDKMSSRLTYAVKNKQESLKTWDISTILDLYPGYTKVNLKMHLTRIVPGQKDYKICVEGVKKFGKTGVTGHLNVAMSQTADGKCVTDDTVIDVTMMGERSEEQEKEHHIYESCHYTIPYSVQPYHTLQCVAAHSSIRHYVYNIKTTKVPTEFKKTFDQLWDMLKGYYMSYYSYTDEHTENIGEHNLKLDVLYPMQTHEVDLKMTTSQHMYQLSAIPTHYWQWLGFLPDSTYYAHYYLLSHDLGMLDHCHIYMDHYHLNSLKPIPEMLPETWTLYVGDNFAKLEKAIYLKQVPDKKMAMKVVDDKHTLEIIPMIDNTFEIHIDGKLLSMDLPEFRADWMYLHMFNDVKHPIVMMFPHMGVHAEFDGQNMLIVMMEIHGEIKGRCSNHMMNTL